jgi:DNA replication protein DnaD
MTWPMRWFLPVETALNVYEVLTTMNRAMSNMEGEELAKWNSDNRRIVDAALAIQKNRDGIEGSDE